MTRRGKNSRVDLGCRWFWVSYDGGKRCKTGRKKSSYRNSNRVTVTRMKLKQFSSSDLIRSLDENWGKKFLVELNKSRKVRANSNSNSNSTILNPLCCVVACAMNLAWTWSDCRVQTLLLGDWTI